MKNGILNELISTMRERIPQDMNLANTLADILCMGKEAVYRRLRGEVSFTIDEVALLSKNSVFLSTRLSVAMYLIKLLST